MNKRELKKALANMRRGDVFYLNAIGLTVGAIEYLKELISTGQIIPDKQDIDSMIAPEAREKCYNGEIICPQCAYTVQ